MGSLRELADSIVSAFTNVFNFDVDPTLTEHEAVEKCIAETGVVAGLIACVQPIPIPFADLVVLTPLYLKMTLQVLETFGGQVENTRRGFAVENGGLHAATVPIEPDASAAVYPMVAAAITGRQITVPDLPADSLQPDLAVAGFLEEMGCKVDMQAFSTTVQGPGDRLEPLDADLSSCPDGAVALAVACL